MEKVREQEIKEKMLEIAELIEQSQSETTVESVTYYADFNFKGSGLAESNVFVAKTKNSKDNSTTYEIYSEMSNSLIATVDSKGKLHFMPEYIEKLKQIDEKQFQRLHLEDLDFELPEELQKEDMVLSKEEKEEDKDQKTLKTLKDTLGEEEVQAYSEMKTDEAPLFDKITNKQEIDANVRVTETQSLADMIPEIKEKGFVKIGVAFSNSKSSNCGRFTFLGITKDGSIEPIESLQNIEGTTTGQKVTSINSSDGSIIETEQVSGLAKLPGNREEYFSVKQGQYGTIEVDYVRRQISKEKEESYFSAPIETHNIKPTTKEVREIMDKHHNTRIDDELDKAKPELQNDGETRIENIDSTATNDMLDIDDIILLEDGSKTTIRQEAKKAKISPEEFLEKYEHTGGETPDDIIDKVHEEVEEEFIGKKQR